MVAWSASLQDNLRVQPERVVVVVAGATLLVAGLSPEGPPSIAGWSMLNSRAHRGGIVPVGGLVVHGS